MLPKLVLYHDHGCCICEYSPFSDRISNDLMGTNLSVRPIYMIYDYDGKLFFRNVQGVTRNDNGIFVSGSLGIAYSYCCQCVEKALYDHYETLFAPIDIQQLLGEYKCLKEIVGDSYDNIEEILKIRHVEELKKINVRAVIENHHQ